MIAGVCGGIAEWMDWDPTVVRLAYVLRVDPERRLPRNPDLPGPVAGHAPGRGLTRQGLRPAGRPLRVCDRRPGRRPPALGRSTPLMAGAQVGGRAMNGILWASLGAAIGLLAPVCSFACGSAARRTGPTRRPPQPATSPGPGARRRPRPGRLAGAKAPAGLNRKLTRKFHGVSVKPGLHACKAVQELVGQRFLPDEAPAMPLAGLRPGEVPVRLQPPRRPPGPGGPPVRLGHVRRLHAVHPGRQPARPRAGTGARTAS